MTTARTPKDDFIDQMTRKLLVEWCDLETQGGSIWEAISPRIATDHMNNSGRVLLRLDPYVEHAKMKGWISKDGTRILSTGWQTAARFLKR